MIVDCAHCRDGRRQHEGPMRPEEAAAICGRDPGFVWLGMVNPSDDDLPRRRLPDRGPPGRRERPALVAAAAYPLMIVLMVLTALALHREFKRAGWL